MEEAPRERFVTVGRDLSGGSGGFYVYDRLTHRIVAGIGACPTWGDIVSEALNKDPLNEPLD